MAGLTDGAELDSAWRWATRRAPGETFDQFDGCHLWYGVITNDLTPLPKIGFLDPEDH